MEHATTCAACGEPARLLCAGCGQTFCVDHLERRFSMGYFYFCAACLQQVGESENGTAAPNRAKKRTKGSGD